MKTSELKKKTVAELRVLARGMGLPGYSAMRKAELIEAIGGGAKGASATGAASTGKSGGKKSTGRRVAAKKAASGKTSANKIAARKSSAKKAAAKKTVARKTPATKTAPRKVSAKKTAARKASAKAAGRRPGVHAGAGEVEGLVGRGLSPRTRRAFSIYRALGEQRIRASKYYLGVQRAPDIDDGFMFPTTHGENIAVLMVRDPYWLFSYWEFAPNLNEDLLNRVGEEALRKSRLVLRVYDVTGTDAEHPVSFHDIDVAIGARDWYINVTHVESEYCVDIGVILPDGTFVVIARSNRVSLPPIGPSEEVDESWVSIESLGDIYRHTERGPTSGSGGWGSGGWGRG